MFVTTTCNGYNMNRHLARVAVISRVAVTARVAVIATVAVISLKLKKLRKPRIAWMLYMS